VLSDPRSDTYVLRVVAGLLEVNTGPVMAEEDEGLCGGMIATVMDPVNNPAGDPLGGWEGLLPDRSS
jgi:hypothetical protein